MTSRNRALLTALSAAAGVSLANAQYTATILSAGTGDAAYAAYNGVQAGHLKPNAEVWSGTAASGSALDTTGGAFSWTARGAYGGQFVGTETFLVSGNLVSHACMWNGSGGGLVDLGLGSALATDGNFQGGIASLGAITHSAALWNGTAASVISLNPSGSTSSDVNAALNGYQAGDAHLGGIDHAVLWHGSASSYVDLNGSFGNSIAYGMDANHVVGRVFTGSSFHAIVWNNSASSYLDLHPAGFTTSFAQGIANGTVVGYGQAGATSHALAWTGSTAFDLQSLMPAGFTQSRAYGIDPVTGQIVGTGTDSSGNQYAVLWTPAVPEPSSLLVTGAGLLVVIRRRRI